MTSIFSKFFHSKEREEKAQFERENRQLVSDLAYVCNRLREIRAAYDLVCEDELVEAMIYEEKSLMSKYSYLLRIAKERKLTNIPVVSQ